ncbi:MAG: alpha/beta hydrolase, partial [Pseudomonadota bacterium]|nr:alpha/beta hydrolase [Pseudomonadota bacterium]
MKTVSPVHISGHGHPLLFIHGGPGSSHRYFRPWVDPLSARFRLVFYDQAGCTGPYDPQTPLTLEVLQRQLAGIVAGLDEKPVIAAHSWGAFLLASAVRDGILSLD